MRQPDMCKEQDLGLGGCYHTGFTYCIGYYVNGELELHSEIFTNLKTGLGGGAMAKLRTSKDGLSSFVVALKPVKIIVDQDDKIGEKCDDACQESCDGNHIDDMGRYDNYENAGFTDKHIEDTECCKQNCDCEDEFDKEFVLDTFRSMNTLDREKWLKTQAKNLMEKPLPCPFCGGKAIQYENCGRYYIKCCRDECSVGPSVRTASISKQQGIKRWNRRKGN